MDNEARLIFVIIIMMGVLIIIGFPKIVIGVEYLSLCPLAPYVPLYLLVSGVLGVACPLYSVYVWMCVFDRTATHRDNTVWMMIWIFIALTIPIIQIAGGPYIIYTYAMAGNYSARCDDFNYQTGGINITNRYLQTDNETDQFPNSSKTTQKRTEISDSLEPNPTYALNYIKNVSDFQTAASNFSSCLFCDHVVMESAFVTVVIEYVFVTLPMIIISIAVISFKRQHSKESDSCTCC